MRILWVTRNCLLDHSSGASLSAKGMLTSLLRRGADITVVSATTFDSEAARRIFFEKTSLEPLSNQVVKAVDGGIINFIVKTISYDPNAIQLIELHTFLDVYKKALSKYQPDIVWMYGGTFFERALIEEAKARNIKTAFYLVNGNYHGDEWHQSLDRIFTDSKATTEFYRVRDGIHPIPLGTFIDKEKIVPAHMERRHVTFVNPSRSKGSLLVAQLALALETRRPDILFEVVEGRSPWAESVKAVSRAQGDERTSLENVITTPMTQDMRTIYGRSRVVLAPSLWWESGSRVLAEASLNWIPAVVPERGGSPEMIGLGGVTLKLPENMYEKPYDKILDPNGLEVFVALIERLYDDTAYYAELVLQAKQHGEKNHNIERNADVLYQEFRTLLAVNN
jgi:glycosyltransferase involved in cell wall biosynthesis